MRRLICFIVFLKVVVIQVYAQEPEQLNNRSVIKLVGSKLGHELIVQKIRTTPVCTFDFTVDELTKLKQGNVSDSLILVMMKRMEDINLQRMQLLNAAQGVQNAATTAPVPKMASELTLGDVFPGIDTTSLGSSGLYYFVPDTRQFIKLKEASMTAKGNAGMGSFVKNVFTLGLGSKDGSLQLANPTSNTRILNPNPVFYFIFNPAAPGGAYSSVQSQNGIDIELKNNAVRPDETTTPEWFKANYALLRLQAGRNSRSLESGKNGAAASVMPCEVVRIASRVMKVILNTSLDPGEYIFLKNTPATTAGTAAGNITTYRGYEFTLSPSLLILR